MSLGLTVSNVFAPSPARKRGSGLVFPAHPLFGEEGAMPPGPFGGNRAVGSAAPSYCTPDHLVTRYQFMGGNTCIKSVDGWDSVNNMCVHTSSYHDPCIDLYGEDTGDEDDPVEPLDPCDVSFQEWCQDAGGVFRQRGDGSCYCEGVEDYSEDTGEDTGEDTDEDSDEAEGDDWSTLIIKSGFFVDIKLFPQVARRFPNPYAKAAAVALSAAAAAAAAVYSWPTATEDYVATQDNDEPEEEEDDCYDQYKDEKDRYCGQPRGCTDADTCASATAKVSAGHGCVGVRTNIQKNCFKPGDEDYQTHMLQIAQATRALNCCLEIMNYKCLGIWVPPARSACRSRSNP